MNHLGRFADGSNDTGWTRVLFVVDEFSGEDRDHAWTEVKWGQPLYGTRFDLVLAHRKPATTAEEDWWDSEVLTRVPPHGRVVTL